MDAITPTLAILASALKIEHLTDASMLRAADNGLSHMATEPLYDFDGSELRIWSQGDAGVQYVTDGLTCTCKGGRHAICKHRALFRLLLAREVLLDPYYVRVKILEQLAPLDREEDAPPEEPPPPTTPPAIGALATTDEDDWYIA
jgi:hypothetical protein